VKPACIQVEADYHGLSIAEMIQRRGELRAKRLRGNQQERGVELYTMTAPRVIQADGGPVPASWADIVTQRPGLSAFRPERVAVGRHVAKLDPGEACWCNLGKDCDGSHEIGPITVHNVHCDRT
jgi:hypothetical protein